MISVADPDPAIAQIPKQQPQRRTRTLMGALPRINTSKVTLQKTTANKTPPLTLPPTFFFGLAGKDDF
jgi:hypothetical protein